jgi:threonine/homoserine/homoserine lactone efflux protein
MLSGWFSLFVVCLLGAMSPGPSFVVVMRNALYRGRSAGLAAAWAHASGIGFWAFLTVTGLSVAVESVPALFVAIAVLGGAFLVRLGIKSLTQTTGLLEETAAEKTGTPRQGAREGALIAFLNPKTGLFFLALFTPFVTPGAGIARQGLMVLTPFLTDGLWFSTVTLVLVRPRALRFLRSRALLVNRISGVVLLMFALGVFGNVARFLFF